MNYQECLSKVKQLAKTTDWYQDFTNFEAALLANLSDERRYGPSEQTRRDRNRILDQLNGLCLNHLGISFNDFCFSPNRPSPAPTQSIPTQIDFGVDSTLTTQLYGTGKRWAILTGVNHYDDEVTYGELHVCVKDAEDLESHLYSKGFDSSRVRVLTDKKPELLPTRENILLNLKTVAEATDPHDLLLFYYSGHGDQEDKESYLVARNGHHSMLRDTAIPISRVKEIMEQANARAKVIILDACHSGANIGGKGAKTMSEAFIHRVFEEAEGLVILASCKQHQLSYEWRKQEQSVFSHFLLEAIKGQADFDSKGFVTVHDAARYVIDGVKYWASQRDLIQTPTLESKLVGDIVLVKL